MLSKRQARHVKRAIDLKLTFNKNMKLVNSYKPMQKELTSLLANLGMVEDELPEKDTNGTGDTTAKDTLKTVVAKESSTICGIAKSYAVATGNAELEAVMGCSYSEVLKMKDTQVLGWVTKQYNMLTPLLNDEAFMEYGITQEMLAMLLDDGQKFNDAIGKGTTKDKDSNVANNNIDAAIRAMYGNVKQFDLLIKHFAKSNPDFVKAYQAAKKLNDAGVKHSGVTGVVKKGATGELLEKAVVRLADTNKQTKSSLKGVYEIIKVRSGEYKLEVVVNDVVVKAVVIDIERGKILEMDIAV